MAEREKPDKHKPGPDPERLKLHGNWKDAMRHALRIPKPKGGWPKPEGKADRNG